MDDSGHRENGRYRADQYRSLHTQLTKVTGTVAYLKNTEWMMPQHHIKDHPTIKLMTLMAERDTAIQERDLALSEKKVALAGRDMAMLQRDAAIAERNSAIMERDNAIAALEFTRQNMDGNGRHGSLDVQDSPPQLADAPFDHVRGMHISDVLPISIAVVSDAKVQQSKRHNKETKTQVVPSKKASNSPRKSKKGSFKNPADATGTEAVRGGEGRKRRASRNDYEWKDQDLGLNLVNFDESSMPPPVCSCTGKSHQCYKWGDGGWQSACCTTKMSMYPLPMMPDKPHARVGGRKMSGSAFAKLLSRLAAEGHDLSMPLDLKNHWARHGTNRYITIR